MGLPWDACTAASYYVVACFICIEEIERPGGHLYEKRDKQEKIRKNRQSITDRPYGDIFCSNHVPVL
jgi:hypothetical protein